MAGTSESPGEQVQKGGRVSFFDEYAAEKMPGGEKIDVPDAMKLTIIESIKSKSSQELQEVLQELEKSHSGVTRGVATAVGAGTGAATSLAALSSLGTVSGLSAAGVTTGLVAAGELIGGGMLVGVGVLAAPVAALGVLGYGLARKRQNRGRAVAVGLAVKKIRDIRSQLMQYKEHFGAELAHIKTVLEKLTSLKTA